METTGQRFKKIRTYLNLAQDDFGSKIGLSKSAVSAVENDKSFISIEIQRTLFMDYNINLNWLVCGVGSMFNKKPVQYEQVEEEFEAKVEAVLKKKGIIL